VSTNGSSPRTAADASGLSVHRVVIVGGGFAGLFAGRRLRHVPVAVTLVDRSANHVFQPMLYQCATGIVPPATIAPTLRAIFRRQPNMRVRLAEVVDVDLDRRVVTTRTPTGEDLVLPYDSLIVGTGAGTSYFGHDELARYAPGMKTIDDAVAIGRRIFGAFEIAAMTEDPDRRRAWLTFAIVGAGPTGVELSGQIRMLALHTLRREFRAIDPTQCHVVLLDGGKEPLATFGDRLSERATRALEKMGVELQMGCLVTNVDAGGLDVKDHSGEVRRIDARTVVWAAGVAASPLGRQLADRAGAEVDRAGRVKVLPDCTLPGHPEVFVVGDLMALDKLPGVAEVAMQSGMHAANSIKRRLEGKPVKNFRYVDMGSMAYVGRGHAIVDFKGLKLSGRMGWFMWAAVHMTFLTGFQNRFAALGNWLTALAGVRRQRIFCADDLAVAAPDPAPAQPRGAGGG
jgi:NADH:ubiquinone reductase (H+-translocating)